MEKVMVFVSNADPLTKEVNEWLSKNGEKIEIISRKIAGIQSGIIIAIFYKEKN